MKPSTPGMDPGHSPPPPAPGEPPYFSSQISDARRFYLNLNPAPGRGFAVVSGGVERCRADYTIDRGGFPHPTLEFVSRGAGRLVLRDQTYELTPGTVFSYGRNLPHRITSDPQAPLVKYFIVVAGETARRLLREWDLGPGRVVHTAHPEQIQPVFEDLIRHGLGDRAGRMRVCAAVAEYLIIKIGDSAVQPRHLISDAQATYERCRSFIEEHFEKVNALGEVAAACHVDLAYLCRIFQRFRRESPFKYLQHLRMNRAAEMLQAGRLVKDVADELGFSEPGNFSRAFQRVFGLPPARVRLGAGENLAPRKEGPPADQPFGL